MMLAMRICYPSQSASRGHPFRPASLFLILNILPRPAAPSTVLAAPSSAGTFPCSVTPFSSAPTSPAPELRYRESSQPFNNADSSSSTHGKSFGGGLKRNKSFSHLPTDDDCENAVELLPAHTPLHVGYSSSRQFAPRRTPSHMDQGTWSRAFTDV